MADLCINQRCRPPSDSLGRVARDVVQVVAHGDEQVEEHAAPTGHFHLHGAAALKGTSASHDQRQKVGSQARVSVRRMRICKAHRAQDGADFNATLQTLLAQCQSFEVIETKALSCAVDGRVPKDEVAHARVVHGGTTACFPASSVILSRRLLGGEEGGVLGALKVPQVALLVVEKTRRVVALVEELEKTRKDFGFFVAEV